MGGEQQERAGISIEEELGGILDCFTPSEEFHLYRCHSEFIPDWSKWGNPIVLRYDPNEHLRTFHALVAALINVMGNGSGYLKRYRNNPDQFADEPHKAARTKKFFTPNIFGDFKPHFTLINPYKGPDRQGLVQKLEKEFSKYETFVMRSVCLLVQSSIDENWVIHKEYQR
jgi:hypothetical protein